MSKNIFQRTEKKYRLTKTQYQSFLALSAGKIEADQFGLHTISNIYYDTENYDLIRHSIDKPKYKEKFRVRGYGKVDDDSQVYLEIKKKVNGVVYKRRTQMNHKQARRYLQKRIFPDRENQILKEIEYFMKYYEPVPKVYLAYDRIAYIGVEDPEIRITVDQNIRSRDEELELTAGDHGTVLEEELYLMEVKVPLAYPIWLTQILSELKIYPVSFSKYGAVYKELTEERKKEEMRLCLQAHLAV